MFQVKNFDQGENHPHWFGTTQRKTNQIQVQRLNFLTSPKLNQISQKEISTVINKHFRQANIQVSVTSLFIATQFQQQNFNQLQIYVGRFNLKSKYNYNLQKSAVYIITNQKNQG